MDTEIPEKKNFLSFVKSNSKTIISIVSILILFFVTYIWFDNNKKKRNIKVSEDFINAKILLEQGKDNEAKNQLEKIINKRNSVYSPLSLFLIIDKDLESNNTVIINYFDVILSITTLDDEDINLIKLKKAIFISESSNEQEILKLLNPIINSNSVWKLQSAKFLGDFYFSLKQFKKAKEYYSIIINENIEDLDINEIKRRVNTIDNE